MGIKATKDKFLEEDSISKTYLGTIEGKGQKCYIREFKTPITNSQEKRDILEELKRYKEIDKLFKIDPVYRNSIKNNFLEKMKTYYTKILKYNFDNTMRLNIITPFYEGKRLSDLIKDKSPLLQDEKNITKIFVQLVLSLYLLEKNRLVFQDLRPENILVDEKTLFIKLLNFVPLSLVNQQRNQLVKAIQSMKNQAGDSPTAAPKNPDEALVYYLYPDYIENPLNFIDKNMFKKTVFWALGCILYEMCTFKKAFEGENLLEIADKIANSKTNHPSVEEKFSLEIRTYIEIMFTTDKSFNLEVIMEYEPFNRDADKSCVCLGGYGLNHDFLIYCPDCFILMGRPEGFTKKDYIVSTIYKEDEYLNIQKIEDKRYLYIRNRSATYEWYPSFFPDIYKSTLCSRCKKSAHYFEKTYI